MRRRVLARRAVLVAALLGAPLLIPGVAAAWDKAELETKGRDSLDRLYRTYPGVRELGEKAVAVLVFPEVVKGGFVVGGQTGNGVLIRKGHQPRFYNLAAVSYGLQAGAQVYSYALFFMNTEALAFLDRTQGLSIGAGPTVVVVDQGLAKSVTSTTLTQDVYAIPFGQTGLMAGAGLEGSKITHLPENGS